MFFKGGTFSTSPHPLGHLGRMDARHFTAGFPDGDFPNPDAVHLTVEGYFWGLTKSTSASLSPTNRRTKLDGMPAGTWRGNRWEMMIYFKSVLVGIGTALGGVAGEAPGGIPTEDRYSLC